MEQKPMSGVEPLAPPSPEIARLYLAEAQAVEERREDRIDRRAGAWRSIVGAVQLGVLFTAYTLVIPQGVEGVQPLLLLVLVTGQISAGFADRRRVQWRLRGWQWALVVLFVIAFVASFIPIVVAPSEQPFWLSFVPGTLILLSGVASAIGPLWKSRGAPGGEFRQREPLPIATRYATAALGVVLGANAVSLGFIGDLPASIVMAVLFIMVVAWMFAWMTDFGPQAFGRYWSPVQEAAFGMATVIIIVLSLLRAFTDLVTPLIALTGGVLAALVLVGAALLGYRRPSHGEDR